MSKLSEFLEETKKTIEEGNAANNKELNATLKKSAKQLDKLDQLLDAFLQSKGAKVDSVKEKPKEKRKKNTETYTEALQSIREKVIEVGRSLLDIITGNFDALNKRLDQFNDSFLVGLSEKLNGLYDKIVETEQKVDENTGVLKNLQAEKPSEPIEKVEEKAEKPSKPAEPTEKVEEKAEKPSESTGSVWFKEWKKAIAVKAGKEKDLDESYDGIKPGKFKLWLAGQFVSIHKAFQEGFGKGLKTVIEKVAPLVLGLILLAGFIISGAKWLWSKVEGVFADIKEWFADKFEAVTGVVKNVVTSVTDFVSRIFDNIKGWLSRIFGKFASKVDVDLSENPTPSDHPASSVPLIYKPTDNEQSTPWTDNFGIPQPDQYNGPLRATPTDNIETITPSVSKSPEAPGSSEEILGGGDGAGVPESSEGSIDQIVLSSGDKGNDKPISMPTVVNQNTIFNQTIVENNSSEYV